MTNYFCLAVSVLITLEAAHKAAGQDLVHRSFDQLFAGDDPGELFTFNLTFDPFVPTVVRFNGHFENLAVDATGVRFALSWWQPDGTVDGLLEQGFMPLPGYGQLPIQVDQPIGFTPSTVVMHVEGGGPADYFRFVGDLTVQQVPEPRFSTMLIAAAVLARLCRRCMGSR